MLIGIAAALVAAGCGGDGDDMSADLRRQLDVEEAARMMADGELAVLRAQVEMLMGRADISPDDLATLQDRLETLMGRADISPDDLAMLQAQLETLMGRADISPDDLTALQAQVETLMDRADISPDDLAALQTQIETLMGRADISPDDLTALQAQVETLMGRADISPDDLAALQVQIETLMGRADISPDDLTALQAQVETLMDRADISPDDLAALQTQIETLMGRADISPDDLAALQAQLDTLMDRADISPDDLTALQAQVETLMGRADISPDDLAALQVQLMSVQGQLEGAKEAAIAERIGNTASPFYDTSIAANSHLEGYETGWYWSAQSSSSGSRYAAITQTYKDGSYVYNASAWNGEDGQIEFHVGTAPRYYPLQTNPWVDPGRLIYTPDRNQAEHGVTTSLGALEGPGLEPWRGFEATKAYDAGGSLSVRYFTDLEDLGNVGAPYLKDEDSIQRFQQRAIVLNDPRVPALPANWDTLEVAVPDDGLAGSLGGAAGRFSCAPGTNCFLASDRPVEPRYPFSSYIPFGTVVFTPDDGSGPEELAPVSNEQVAVANYVSFGSWLYVPPDVTDANAFEFGVFAGGDDPFMPDNLMGLEGTADYAGAAAGMYAESLPGGETVGTFNAKVELTADFGTTGDFGNIGGKVYEFELDSGKTPPLTEVMLLTQSWRDPAGTRNIFLTLYNTEIPPAPGGWIDSYTLAEGTDGRVWDGIWTGKFLGNGSTAEEHPGSFAGTFGVRDATDSFTLAGSFGTHRQ